MFKQFKIWLDVIKYMKIIFNIYSIIFKVSLVFKQNIEIIYGPLPHLVL